MDRGIPQYQNFECLSPPYRRLPIKLIAQKHIVQYDGTQMVVSLKIVCKTRFRVFGARHDKLVYSWHIELHHGIATATDKFQAFCAAERKPSGIDVCPIPHLTGVQDEGVNPFESLHNIFGKRARVEIKRHKMNDFKGWE